MPEYRRNPRLLNRMLPVEFVFAPAWWRANTGMRFDVDFFYDPTRRVAAEQQMEQALFERWGAFGLGEYANLPRPEVGPVHLAAGYLIQEMLGCKVIYAEEHPPEVLPLNGKLEPVDVGAAFSSPAFVRFTALVEALKSEYGYVCGDVNWSGVLNVALDLRGQALLMDMMDQPGKVGMFFESIADVIERFVDYVEGQTGTSSISVNRIVRHIEPSIALHSECSHTMIATRDYDTLLKAYDERWCTSWPGYGIHYCGKDPHRYAKTFASLPRLDFLDLGWGGDVAAIRAALPETFLSIRMSPVWLIDASVEAVKETVRRLVRESGNPWLTGVCCINMDEKVSDDKVTAILETVQALRDEYEE